MVACFVIGDVVFPTAPQDTNPFEGQGAKDGVVPLAGGFLALIKRMGPSATRDRLAGPFHEGLTQELGCGPAPMYPDPNGA